MLKKLLAAVLVLAVIWSAPAQAAETIPPEKVKSAQVFAEICRWNLCYNTPVGSGFFIKGGYVITNYHVIDTYDKVSVKDGTGKTYAVDLYGYDNDLDLAMLRLREPVDHPYFELADEVKGLRFGAYASSGDAAFEFKTGPALHYMQAAVTAPDGSIMSNRVRIVFGMLAIPGNSGTGVFDDQGKIVAVVLAQIQDTKYAVAVKLEDLKEFIDRMFDGNDANNRRIVIHEQMAS